MHQARAYQSLTPANNMILKKRWDKSRFELHRMKVHSSNLSQISKNASFWFPGAQREAYDRQQAAPDLHAPPLEPQEATDGRRATGRGRER